MRFELWVNHVESRTSRIVHETQLTTTSFTSLTNLPQGTFRAWVRGYNSAGEVGEWSTPFSFSIDIPSPTIPVVTAPVANAVGTVGDATPTFVWTRSTNTIATYDVQVENITTGSLVIDTRGVPTEQYTSEIALQEERYRVRVRGVNSVGEVSDWSAWFDFRIDVPNATTPIPIAPNGTVTDSAVTFEWQHTAGNTRYEILVRDLLRQESIVIQVSTSQLSLGNNTAVYTQDGINAGTYRWWVRAFNSQGAESSWSNSQSFNVAARTNADEDAAAPLNDVQVLLTSFASGNQEPEQTPAEHGQSPRTPVRTAHETEAEAESDGHTATENIDVRPSSELFEVMVELADPAAQLLMVDTADET